MPFFGYLDLWFLAVAGGGLVVWFGVWLVYRHKSEKTDYRIKLYDGNGWTEIDSIRPLCDAHCKGGITNFVHNAKTYRIIVEEKGL